MLNPRRAAERGRADLGWLNSHHSFSFASYYDPAHSGISNLRVLNDDVVGPGGGFDTHGHQNMEIVSYVLDGELEHRDSMGNGSVMRPGDVQRMSAGRGVLHSEFNASKSEPVHFLQIWFLPDANGGEPQYAQEHFPLEARRDRWQVLISPDGREGSLATGQRSLLVGSLLSSGASLSYQLQPTRQAYVHLVRGNAEVSGLTLAPGDGAYVEAGSSLEFQGVGDDAEILLFDLV